MKKKYIAILMGLMMTASSISVYAADTDTAVESTQSTEDTTSDEDSGKEETEDVTYGEVKSVEDGKLTISVGTKKDMGGESGQAPEKPEDGGDNQAPEKPEDGGDNQAPEKPEDSGDNQAPEESGEAPSMLDLTGEELTVTVTDDTVITKMSGGPGGEKPDGQPGEKPEDGNADSLADEKADTEDTTEDSEKTEDKDAASDVSDEDAKDQGEAPAEKPDGQPDGQPGGQPQSEAIALSDIQEGDVVAVTMDEDGNALSITVENDDMGGGQGGPGGAPGDQAQGVDSYQAAYEYNTDTDVTDTTLESTGTDENAALVSSGSNVTFDNVEISRNSSDSTGGDNSSFYGVGAAVLATDGTASVKNSTITTDAAGGAGLFAYGDGTVYAADTTIKTSQDTSGGIHAAGGGKLYAWDLNVETDGESAAAIRSDRGGGTMVVNGGTYTSNGVGSPAVYCTADIAVKDAALTANGSEAVCIEGLNSLHLYGCDLTGNMSDLSQNDSTWTVILYQSMSGDSEVGNSTFQMDGGSITSKNGGVFYTTNTESDITLQDVDITYNDDNEYFLRCTGNNNERGWGQSGANGADCDFTAISQDMQGDVIWDSISDLDFYLTEGSTLKGAVTDDESFAGNGGDGYCNMYVSKDSTWTVTGDSTLTTLSNEGNIVDESGKTVPIKGTDGTVYAEGDSEYTITVDKYQDTVDASGSVAMAGWSDYEVEKPDSL